MTYNFDVFKIAQRSSYSQALAEMKNGKKLTHWMWFIFPQIAGLGKSENARKYEIKNIEEARQYLLEETLGKRLIELTSILAYHVTGKSAEQIFGYPDYVKWHSSLTLFYVVVHSYVEFKKGDIYKCFEDALNKYYNGKTDLLTMKELETMNVP